LFVFCRVTIPDLGQSSPPYLVPTVVFPDCRHLLVFLSPLRRSSVELERTRRRSCPSSLFRETILPLSLSHSHSLFCFVAGHATITTSTELSLPQQIKPTSTEPRWYSFRPTVERTTPSSTQTTVIGESLILLEYHCIIAISIPCSSGLRPLTLTSFLQADSFFASSSCV
jgi:hypothetical protein